MLVNNYLKLPFKIMKKIIRSFYLFRNDLVNRKEAIVIRIEQPLILISQIQRSGGTLMLQLFDNHPECHVYPGEIEWGRPVKYNWPDLEKNMDVMSMFQCLYECGSEVFESNILSGFSKQSWVSKNKEYFPFSFNRTLQKRIFLQSFVKHPPRTQREILNQYLTSFFNAWIDYQNLYQPAKKYVTGFIPRINMYNDSAKRFFNDYPDGFMVSMIRHPASWFASARKHNPQEYGQIDDAIDLWCASVNGSLNMEKTYGERVILILFEDLIAYTTGTMKTLSQKIGITWDDTLTFPTFNSMSIKADSSFDVKQHGIVKETIDRYRDQISSDEMKIIDVKAMSLYREGIVSCINQIQPEQKLT